jgi:hypothetical protein
MDIGFWIVLARGPLEIIALGLAIFPAAMVLQSWGALPRQIPVRFGITGRPDRWGGRGQAWILPLLALIVYALMSTATGTWAWMMNPSAELPDGTEILLVIKPVIAFLMIRATGMLIRVARDNRESLSCWLLWGLMAILVAPPLALTMAIH